MRIRKLLKELPKLFSPFESMRLLATYSHLSKRKFRQALKEEIKKRKNGSR
jgi:hypothetical protein